MNKQKIARPEVDRLIGRERLTVKFDERRGFLRNVAAGLTLFVPVSAAAVACGGKKLSCTDTTGLTTDEQNQRTTLAYAEPAVDPAKKCESCSLFKPAAPDQCGSCSALKGPISPQAGCTAWAAKV
jgi:hypothetical protein